MKEQFHILNGDSLKAQFPPDLKGGIFVVRECLVDGEVNAADLSLFYKQRKAFLCRYYGATEKQYEDQVQAEFEKIRSIKDSKVFLWFEDDLFCQVNFWFTTSLLLRKNNEVYLVRPQKLSTYGFGGLDQKDLLELYNTVVPLKQAVEIADIWMAYQKEDIPLLRQKAVQLSQEYPFILDAVEAHIQRIPSKDNPGRPIQSLQRIINQLGTTEFAPVFKAFCEEEAIYGFGDLQVKRLLDQIDS